jgi:hypothetical protein
MSHCEGSELSEGKSSGLCFVRFLRFIRTVAGPPNRTARAIPGSLAQHRVAKRRARTNGSELRAPVPCLICVSELPKAALRTMSSVAEKQQLRLFRLDPIASRLSRCLERTGSGRELHACEGFYYSLFRVRF